MANNSLHGRGGMVYLGSGSGAAATKFGLAYGWSIDVTRETAENNVFGDSWVTKLSGFLGFKGKIDGRLDTTDATAFNAALSLTPGSAGVCNMYLYPDQTTTARYYYGQIWPQISINVTLKDIINYTMNLDGYGQLAAN